MDKFRDAYQEACKELPAPSMDVAKVQDELSHQRLLQKRRRYVITRGCAAAAVFLLCGAGTAAAKNYRDSVIKLNDEGFTITSAQDAQSQQKNQESPEYGPDIASFLKTGGVFSIEEDIPEEESSGEKEGIDVKKGILEEKNISGEESPLKERSITEEGALIGRSSAEKGEGITGQDTKDEYMVENFVEMNCREYDSIEAFCEAEKVVDVIPDIALFDEEFTCENIQVLDDGWRVMVRLSNENVCFFMTQVDNSNCESYSSNTSYGGHCANERSFSNEQGLSYVVFDSVDEEGQVISVHAAISVNGWDLSMSFEGFEGNVVEKVLRTVDLSAYF